MALNPFWTGRRLLETVLTGVVLLASISAGAGGTPANAAPIGSVERLSNERTLTLWAHARHPATIHTLPSSTAPRVARLHHSTESGSPEVYILQSRQIDISGVSWIRIRIPTRTNKKTGWVVQSALRKFHRVTTRLIVDRDAREATLFRSGKKIWNSPVGVGAPRTPTPTGKFWVRELLRIDAPSGIYGPFAFGTSAYSSLSDWPGGGVIGIHGTNRPDLIPGSPSHGCIRVPNAAIKRLAHKMPIGTPIQVRN